MTIVVIPGGGVGIKTESRIASLTSSYGAPMYFKYLAFKLSAFRLDKTEITVRKSNAKSERIDAFST